MKYRIFKVPKEYRSEHRFLLMTVSFTEFPKTLFSSNEIKDCYDFLSGILGRAVNDDDLIWYSDRIENENH